ncbi:MAG: hypothetical protein L0Y76_05985 [Ignavibacteria bacterium]|nr:hypothetical protein [Ignavibacteria bacterium]
MEYNKLTGVFPFKRINDVLGGIRTNTEFSFLFHCEDIIKNEDRLKLIPGLENASLADITENMFNKFIEYTTAEIKGNVLIIDYHELYRKVIKGFEEKEVNLCKGGEMHDIFEFLDLLESTDAAKETSEKIKWHGDNNGCIISFHLYTKNSNEGFFSLGIPDNFDNADVIIWFGDNPVETIKTYPVKGKVREYKLPFKNHVKEKMRNAGKFEYLNKANFYATRYEKDEFFTESHLVNKKIFREYINILNPDFSIL